MATSDSGAGGTDMSVGGAGAGGTDGAAGSTPPPPPPPCAQYGQLCTATSDCCTGTMCLGGVCSVQLL
jgi:hypothetical protein